MTDTDLDIILAIADGRLTGRAKEDALTRIAADPELGDALASQIAAMDELKSLEPALMTPSERAALRSALVERLNLQPATPVTGIARHRRPWWQPVLGLASAAALLIAIVAVPSMFSGDDSSSADLVAIAPEASTSADTVTEFDAGGTDAATTESSEAASGTAVIVIPRIGGDDVREFFAAAPPPPDDATATTLAGRSDATGADDEVSADDEEISATSIPLGVLLGEEGLVEVDAGRVFACLDDLGNALPAGELIPGAATIDDDQIIVHFGVDTGGAVVYSISIVLDTCTIAP